MLDTILSGAIEYAQTMSHWETTAVLLGVAYLVLAMRQSQWCWYAAFGSTAIFSWLFFDVSLVMESALNVYYLAMAVYGWLAWRNGASDKPDLSVQRWTLNQHGLAIGSVVLISLISGWLLTNNTNAALPYLDSFTTWGAVLTTWMVTRKVLENWLYWVVIDAVAIYLYIDRGLYLTAVLMALYVVLAIGGYFLWLKDYRSQQGLPEPA
ncbi:nicotinamide riboside transporter PnuC [Thalassolituus maritimus]|uniref:Nicotinamide riboside transporter PnuC n=1 Tax=Thalassolituus maritimus TaxID=484498 RepID=A0ABP9ZXD3_9GAMM